MVESQGGFATMRSGDAHLRGCAIIERGGHGMMNNTEPWYGAKALFHEPSFHYEERVVLIRAANFEDAQKKAIREAREYIKSLERLEFVAIIDIFHIFDERLEDGSEIYSQITESQLKPEEYLAQRYSQWDGVVSHDKVEQD